MLVGLSIVIVMFGSGSPVPSATPSLDARHLIAGFLFGSTGALIALSPVGKISGAHINLAVTLGFLLMQKLDFPVALGSVLAQLAGGILGSLPLLAWGSMGQSVSYGATSPGQGYFTQAALLGEVANTITMVTLLTAFLAFRRIRPFTRALFRPLNVIMVYLKAAVSGTSTNPARSLGPALISGQWHGKWVYWAGPQTGILLALVGCSFLARRIKVAKLYHFDSDRDGLFRREC